MWEGSFGVAEWVLIFLIFGEPDLVDVGVVVLGDQVGEKVYVVVVADEVDLDVLTSVRTWKGYGPVGFCDLEFLEGSCAGDCEEGSQQQETRGATYHLSIITGSKNKNKTGLK